MSAVAIFIYGLFVTTLVLTALALIAWGIVTERRDRLETEAAQKRLTSSDRPADAPVDAHRAPDANSAESRRS